jgi:processive 1,2-diacylglycerol beta-glucosyltransferase
VRENFLRLRYEEDPTTVIDELVALGNEVARAELRRQPFPPPEAGPA